ncbi:MAG: N-acyl amino acid synthase FeeM domain-containing protein [Janthinobacterium lividum]
MLNAEPTIAAEEGHANVPPLVVAEQVIEQQSRDDHESGDLFNSKGENDGKTNQSDLEAFRIRLANSAGLREKAGLLIKKRYEWRGYDVDSPMVEEPDVINLIAITDDKAVGTMTLRLDRPDRLLPADENFPDELKVLREQGRRLSEPSKLAIDENTPKRVFAALIHIMYMYTKNIHDFTDWVIEVNPRHVMFYRRMLGFKPLGSERMCTRVNAPAVLLRLEMSYMQEQIQQFGGLYEMHGKSSTFYHFMFPPKDEPGITGRLRNQG